MTDSRAPVLAPQLLRVDGVRKIYPGSRGGDPTVAIDNLTFDVGRGEFVVVVGPSGCGKTTMLRCLSGLTAPTQGAIMFHGCEVKGVQSGLGVVFQDYTRSLMAWLTVAGNVAFALHDVPAGERRGRVAEAL